MRGTPRRSPCASEHGSGRPVPATGRCVVHPSPAVVHNRRTRRAGTVDGYGRSGVVGVESDAIDLLRRVASEVQSEEGPPVGRLRDVVGVDPDRPQTYTHFECVVKEPPRVWDDEVEEEEVHRRPQSGPIVCVRPPDGHTGSGPKLGLQRPKDIEGVPRRGRRYPGMNESRGTKSFRRGGCWSNRPKSV